MKKIILLLALTLSFSALAGLSYRIGKAQRTVKNMMSRHETMSKAEIVKDVEAMIKEKGNKVLRRKRAKFQVDADKFLNAIKSLETSNDILVFENDIITELSLYDTTNYFGVTGGMLNSSRGDPAAILFLPFTLITDAAISPIKGIYNIVQVKQTKWSRDTVRFLLKY